MQHQQLRLLQPKQRLRSLRLLLQSRSYGKQLHLLQLEQLPDLHLLQRLRNLQFRPIRLYLFNLRQLLGFKLPKVLIQQRLRPMRDCLHHLTWSVLQLQRSILHHLHLKQFLQQLRSRILRQLWSLLGLPLTVLYMQLQQCLHCLQCRVRTVQQFLPGLHCRNLLLWRHWRLHYLHRLLFLQRHQRRLLTMQPCLRIQQFCFDLYRLSDRNLLLRRHWSLPFLCRLRSP